MPRSFREQLEIFKQTLEGETLTRESPVFRSVIAWVKTFPGELSAEDREDLLNRIQQTFCLTADELTAVLIEDKIPKTPVVSNAPDPQVVEDELWALLPRGGFFERYAEYTRHSEAPLAYHVFCALLGVGAIIGRRVYFNMGYYRLYPALGVIILGPSGIKKTSAANIIVDMLTELEITKIYSEKLTPEQLVESMTDTAQGLVYAPEMAVMLGKQKYLEGIIPLLTRFLDCPDMWASETIGRGKTTLRNIAISTLMCSTPDWFISNTPQDTFGGGFIARHIMVVQYSSPRVEPLPSPGDPRSRSWLVNELARVHILEGEAFLSNDAKRAYVDWYSLHKQVQLTPEHELFRTYYERKPDHVKRVAMCLHLIDHDTLTICEKCFINAVRLLDWTEKFLPMLFREMFKTDRGLETEFILNAIAQNGGTIDHTALIRKAQYKYNAVQVKNIIASLKDARQVKEIHDKLAHVYILLERGHK
jgi:hypothetical protein